ncbi:hypothetical protein IU433_25915 [Nocardia puris]|uniref:Uncharacterized protein n=1 Tax=Nocardia puris TaxID=208602 RepID=A0A366E3W5_9NOCA|nr:hypothetical protein [Nocardia puris]MBF6214654.1 hypothetical protein [Nocardia puris]MBF6368872.1 hypothetical protein [Nocardia puris]MBF6462452.1 hypothetical protein [Nocardia puris]RBO97033.1 hypothetical protein DFR74_1011052 [Nocardia puris]
MDVATAARVFTDAIRFSIRHYPVIFCCGALVSAQRFLAVGGGDRFAFAGGVAGELFTLAVRLAFLGWVIATVFRPRVPWRTAADRLGEAFRDRTRLLLASAGILVALAAVFKALPWIVATSFVEPDGRDTFLAWELAVKNVTVIPFTMIWIALLVREIVYDGSESVPRRVTPEPGRRRGIR